MSGFDPLIVRPQFPALQRELNGRCVACFDGPAGSQVPQSVIEAVAGCLRDSNANRGAPFATSRAVEDIFEAAHQAAADLLGTDDPHTTIFGANMTTMTLAMSRASRACGSPVMKSWCHDWIMTPT